jgi:hypothetical protein
MKTGIDIDEFWIDCMNPQSTSNVGSAHQHINKSQDTLEKEHYLNIAKRNSFIQNILVEEHTKPHNRNQRTEQAIEHCVLLYKRSLAKLQLQQENFSKIKSDLNQLELDKCTFKPQTTNNKAMNKKLKDYHNIEIYNRGIKYQQKHLAARLKKYQNKTGDDVNMFSFKPDICQSNLQEVFKENNNKISTQNESNRFFIYRLMKAREEEEFKKNKIINELEKNAKMDWKGKGRIKRSISQKDSLCIRKGLHQELLTAFDEQNKE